MAQNSSFDSLILASANRNGINPALMKAMMHTESGFNPNAHSPVGAMGLGQLMPATARRFGVTNPYDPAQNIEGMARYLKYLQNKFNGNTTKVIASYNAGEGNVMKYGGIPPFKETRDYVQRVSQRLGLYGGGSAPQMSGQRFQGGMRGQSSGMLARQAIFGGKDFAVTSHFGGRKAPVAGASTFHNGLDLGAGKGTPIYAVEDGVVGGNQGGKGGNQLWLNGGSGYRYGFAHLDKYAVPLGSRVRKGQLIGYTGDSGIGTGAHLHFTVTDPRGQKIDPSNFMLPQGGGYQNQPPPPRYLSGDMAAKLFPKQPAPQPKYLSSEQASKLFGANQQMPQQTPQPKYLSDEQVGKLFQSTGAQAAASRQPTQIMSVQTVTPSVIPAIPPATLPITAIPPTGQVTPMAQPQYLAPEQVAKLFPQHLTDL